MNAPQRLLSALALVTLSSVCPAQRGEPGSLLVFPEFDNRTGSLSLITVTNTASNGAGHAFGGVVDVEFVYIGRVSQTGTLLPCLETNVTETLTPNDTLTLLTNAHNPNSQQGYLYVFAKQPGTNVPVSFNHLIGTYTSINGLDAFEYTINPFVYSAMDEEGESTNHDNDDARDLDGIEYDPSPDRVLIPRFIGQDTDYQSELVLVNLTGGSEFTATVDFLLYNDNEEEYSAQLQFVCWTKLPLLAINGAFDASFLANFTGQDPQEVFGAPQLETGWIRIDGALASSSSTSISNPAIVGYLVERVYGTSMAGVPFGTGVNYNGDLVNFGPLGDTAPNTGPFGPDRRFMGNTVPPEE